MESLAALTAAICCIRILQDKPWLWDSGSAGFGERTRRSKGIWSQAGACTETCTYLRGLKGQAERHRLVPEGTRGGSVVIILITHVYGLLCDNSCVHGDS